MPAAVESMMYVGVAPWHRLGVQVQQEVSSAEAIKKAGLDWDADLRPLYADSSPVSVGGTTATVLPVPDHRAVVRSTDRTVLGVVGDRYHAIQNRDAFSWFDPLVREGQATFETAGSLDGGKRIWVLARLKQQLWFGRDEAVHPYLLLASSHDGSASLRMLPTPVRVQCFNTLTMALDDGAGEGVTIKHTESAPARMEQAQKALRVANRFFYEFELEAQRLLSARYTDAQMVELSKTLFPDRDDEPSPRGRKAREKLVELFTQGIGHQAIAGTAWAGVNAVAEYVDHYRLVRVKPGTSREEARLSSSWFGTGAALKRRAHEVVMQQLAA